MTTTNSNKSLWTATIYFALSFFVLGVTAMIHFFLYPTFDKVHEHISSFMELFNYRAIIILYIPLSSLLLLSIYLFRVSQKTFSKWIIWASIILSFIATITTFFILIPIQNSYTLKGFEIEKYNELQSYSLTFQLIPLFLQAILAIILMNSFLSNIKGKWVFIALFGLAFYTAGTDFTEKLLNYPLWLNVSSNEWLSFRQSVKSITFPLVYLIPAFLSLLPLILMFWFRPLIIKKKIVVIYLCFYLFISIVTSVYFVPILQIPLDKTYSTTLIEQLIKKDFPLRFLPGLITYSLTLFMFIKIGKWKMEETK